jgi:hypothetical protein
MAQDLQQQAGLSAKLRPTFLKGTYGSKPNTEEQLERGGRHQEIPLINQLISQLQTWNRLN